MSDHGSSASAPCLRDDETQTGEDADMAPDGQRRQSQFQFQWQTRYRTKAIAIASICLAVLLSLFLLSPISRKVTRIEAFPLSPASATASRVNLTTYIRPNTFLDFPTNASPSPCRGPRGVPVSASHDYPAPLLYLPNVTYPVPTVGSWEALGLEQTWLSARQRYGPYGYGENKDDYKYTKAEWPKVNWGQLQHECVLSSRGGKPGQVGSTFNNAPRFRYSRDGDGPTPPNGRTGRKAIVLRAWSHYHYEAEDMWNIRSMVTEANLATGGEYEVVLLVDVKDKVKGPSIHTSDEVYMEVLRASVPPEFQDIAVLFHVSLQRDWYAKVGEFQPVFQIMQPLQLFAHFYPEYDHYWQIELDTRFTGDVGKTLQAFHNFGKREPYKQSRERASWSYMTPIHGTWGEFTQKIDRAMKGRKPVWGPIRIKNIEPALPPPPMAHAEDNFQYGVGVEPDLLLMNTLNDINRIATDQDWVFREWYRGGFEKNVPRWMSAPAQARASWSLLEIVHQLQHREGMRVPSEATLPSFALWKGLKVVALPMPKFQYPQRDLWELNRVFNGKMPKDFRDGIAEGPSHYRSSSVNFFTRPLSFAWSSPLPDFIFDTWFHRPTNEAKLRDPPYNLAGMDPPGSPPSFMASVDGEVYAPPMVIHPRKTNMFVS